MLPPPDAELPPPAASPGFDTPSKPTDRLFFALFPDADSAARIAQAAQQLRARHGLKGRPFAAARLHVTLHLLGDYAGGLPPPVVDAACTAAAALALPRLDVAFDRAASFDRKRRNRPFVLRNALPFDDAGERAAIAAASALALASTPAPALVAAMRSVAASMRSAGLGRKPSIAEPPGVPHMTLLYDDRCVAEHTVEPVVGWVAHEFVLVHSLIGHGRHVPLARWPLGG